METDSLPSLAITIGDPAGIGPEIVVKALEQVRRVCRPLVIGDERVLARAQGWTGISVDLPQSGPIGEGPWQGEAGLLDLGNAEPEACPPGKVGVAAGKAAVEYVNQACDLALAGKVDGIVTAPLNKESMNLAGFAFAGHTELLAARTKADKVSMLLVGPQLRVVHVSTHLSLAEAIARVQPARVGQVIDLAHQSCRLLGIDKPRIAIAGLNPHAGEGGLFGDEEASQIQPAIETARRRGWQVSDPQPPDTVFLRAVKGEYDIVVAMYHDQGHIPMKLLAFDSGVNVSIGLPIIRTSVDHGTAFDIAGSGRASEESLVAAVEVACTMVGARRRGVT